MDENLLTYAVVTLAVVAVSAGIAAPAFKKAVGQVSIWWARARGDASVVGEVQDLFVHPVKSMRAVSVTTVRLDEKGFANDRRFMVAYAIPLPVYKSSFDKDESTHRFLTQRQCPSLATVIATVDEENRVLSLKTGEQSVTVPLDPEKNAKEYRAGIWSDQVRVTDMGDKVASFLQRLVDADPECQLQDTGVCMYQDVRLVADTKSDRKTNPKYTPAVSKSWLTSAGSPVSLTDGYPILIASQSSLERLNVELKQAGQDPIPMSRFRPNIVIKGTKAFEEDTWKLISVGGVVFSIVKACPRCKQSCTDQLTGEVHSEPLAVMKKFRALGASGDDVYFAQNAIPIGGKGFDIHVGATVRVLSTGRPVYE